MRTGADLRRPARPRLKYRVLGERAFTIVETLIFLAVTSLTFVLISTSIAGKRGNAEFTDSVHDFESRLRDLANDVSTGYYLKTGNFRCIPNVAAAPAPGVTFTNVGPLPEGTNAGCISVGQRIVFSVPLPSPTYTVNNLAGRQKIIAAGISKDVTSISETQPAVNPYGQNTETINLGTVVGRVTYNDGAVHNAVGLALMTTFGNSGGSLSSTDIHADLVPITATPLVMAAANPVNGFRICLQNGNPATRHADIILGGAGRQLSTQINFGNIANGPCT